MAPAEPVATLSLHRNPRTGRNFVDLHLEDAGRDLPPGEYPLYTAAPMDAELIVLRALRDSVVRSFAYAPGYGPDYVQIADTAYRLWPDEPVASRALLDVAIERQRQISDEGWTADHDDEHVGEEIAAMAAFYAMPPGARDWSAASTGYGDTLGEALRPLGWDAKVGDRRRELVKAGALILAELERMDRAAVAAKETA